MNANSETSASTCAPSGEYNALPELTTRWLAKSPFRIRLIAAFSRYNTVRPLIERVSVAFDTPFATLEVGVNSVMDEPASVFVPETTVDFPWLFAWCHTNGIACVLRDRGETFAILPNNARLVLTGGDDGIHASTRLRTDYTLRLFSALEGAEEVQNAMKLSQETPAAFSRYLPALNAPRNFHNAQIRRTCCLSRAALAFGLLIENKVYYFDDIVALAYDVAASIDATYMGVRYSLVVTPMSRTICLELDGPDHVDHITMHGDFQGELFLRPLSSPEVRIATLGQLPLPPARLALAMMAAPLALTGITKGIGAISKLAKPKPKVPGAPASRPKAPGDPLSRMPATPKRNNTGATYDSIGRGTLVHVGAGTTVTFVSAGEMSLSQDGGVLTIRGKQLVYKLVPSGVMPGIPISGRRGRKALINLAQEKVFPALIDTGAHTTLYPRDGHFEPNQSFKYVLNKEIPVEKRGEIVISPEEKLIVGQDVVGKHQTTIDGQEVLLDTCSDVNVTNLPPSHHFHPPISVNGKTLNTCTMIGGEAYACDATLQQTIKACNYIYRDSRTGKQVSFKHPVIQVHAMPIRNYLVHATEDTVHDPFRLSQSPVGVIGEKRVLLGSPMIAGYDIPWEMDSDRVVDFRVVTHSGRSFVVGSGSRSFWDTTGNFPGFSWVGLNDAEFALVQETVGSKSPELRCQPAPYNTSVMAEWIAKNVNPTRKPSTGTPSVNSYVCMSTVQYTGMGDLPIKALGEIISQLKMTQFQVEKITYVQQAAKMLLSPMMVDNTVALPLGRHRTSALHSLLTAEITSIGTFAKYFGILSLPSLKQQLLLLSARNAGRYFLANLFPGPSGLHLVRYFDNRAFPTSNISRFITSGAATSSLTIPLSTAFDTSGVTAKFYGPLRNNGVPVQSFSGGPAGFTPPQAGGYPLGFSCNTGDAVQVILRYTASLGVGTTATVSFVAVTASSTGALTVTTAVNATIVGNGTAQTLSADGAFTLPACVALVGVQVSVVNTVNGAPGFFTFQEISVALVTGASTFNDACPFSDYACLVSPLISSVLQTNQSSGSYIGTANALFVTDTTAKQYSAGNSACTVVPAGDPSEYGIAPNILEQFVRTRSAPLADGAYMASDQISEAASGATHVMDEDYQFTSSCCVFLAELPLPVLGNYSVRVQSGCVFEVTTEQQILRPMSTVRDTGILDCLTGLFAPVPVVTSNPLHVSQLVKVLRKALNTYAATTAGNLNADKARVPRDKPVISTELLEKMKAAGIADKAVKRFFKVNAEYDDEAECDFEDDAMLQLIPMRRRRNRRLRSRAEEEDEE